MPKKKPKYERALKTPRDYADYPALTEIFPLHGKGLASGRDGFATDFDAKALLVRLEVFRRSTLPAAQAAERLGLPRPGKWNAEAARAALKSLPDLNDLIKGYQHRPFDTRRVAYHETLLDRPETTVLKHLFSEGNRALIVAPAPKGEPFRHVWAVGSAADGRFFSDEADSKTLVFPLYRSTRYGKLSLGEMRNFDYDFLRELVMTLGLKCRYPDGMPKGYTPEDLFHYVYAVLSAPGYRAQYSAELSKGVPRVPLTSSQELFKKLISLGERLAHAHLLEAPELDKPRAALIGKAPVKLEAFSYAGNAVTLSPDVRVAPVGQAVWDFQVGGRPVLKAWLEARLGRRLEERDLRYFLRTAEALELTFDVLKDVDLAIQRHGGWPLKRELVPQPRRPWAGA